MSAGTITITAPGKTREEGEVEFAGPEGTYPVILIRVSPVKTEPAPAQFEQAGKGDGTWSFRDWTFAIDVPGSDIDGQLSDVRATTASGEKSKQFGIIAALVGRTPTVGAQIDIDKHLVGRSALAHFDRNDGGYLRLKTLMPAPTVAATKAAAKAAPASDDALPF